MGPQPTGAGSVWSWCQIPGRVEAPDRKPMFLFSLQPTPKQRSHRTGPLPKPHLPSSPLPATHAVLTPTSPLLQIPELHTIGRTAPWGTLKLCSPGGAQTACPVGRGPSCCSEGRGSGSTAPHKKNEAGTKDSDPSSGLWDTLGPLIPDREWPQVLVPKPSFCTS